MAPQVEAAAPTVEPLIQAPAGFSAADFFAKAFGSKADTAAEVSSEPAAQLDGAALTGLAQPAVQVAEAEQVAVRF